MATTPSMLLDTRVLFDAVGIVSGMTVADLGCGVTGHVSIPAARRVGDTGRVYAVDVQQSALAATESKAKMAGLANITAVWSDLERAGATAIPAGSLDSALLVSTLHVTTNPAAVLHEAARLTKQGGRVLVVDWKPGASPLGPTAERRITPDMVRKHAAAAGLAEQRAFVAGPYHYGFVFTKS